VGNDFDFRNIPASHLSPDLQNFTFRQSPAKESFLIHQSGHNFRSPEATPFARASPVMEGPVDAFVEGQGVSIDINTPSLEPILVLPREDVMTRRASRSGTVGRCRVDGATLQCLINFRLVHGHSALRAIGSNPHPIPYSPRPISIGLQTSLLGFDIRSKHLCRWRRPHPLASRIHRADMGQEKMGDSVGRNTRDQLTSTTDIQVLRIKSRRRAIVRRAQPSCSAISSLV
jgi:hypothetical protein